ncbi:carboxypeptidase Y [Cadophora sp. MPI-SDFR-AT-0126]|nr:carboxypeptidase Y [Leotiomycetes sp. MPI-SDFR-AT-0126]
MPPSDMLRILTISVTNPGFFESRHDPTNNPIILWLNGGPGASSLIGLFEEIGPCSIAGDSKSTIPNPYSWVNNASLLFLDQPAGVGLSTAKTKADIPVTLEQAAADFNLFLRTVFTQLLPQYSQNQVFVAGESFGGSYVPYFVNHILRKQATNSSDVYTGQISSIILVDAAVEDSNLATGLFDLLCYPPVGPKLNATACEAMAAAVPACEKKGRVCLDTYTKEDCSLDECDVVSRWMYDNVVEGGLNPYDLRIPCHGPPVCRQGNNSSGSGSIEYYVKTLEIQRLMRLRSSDYRDINFDINQLWADSGAATVPTTRELSYIIDNSNVRTLIINGNYDAEVSTIANMRVYDNLPWKGQASYRHEVFRDWQWIDDRDGKTRKGGQVKGVDRLFFVTVDDAGHMSPADQPQAVQRIVNSWVQQSDIFATGKTRGPA